VDLQFPLAIEETDPGFRITSADGLLVSWVYVRDNETTQRILNQPSRDRGRAIAQAIVDALTEVFGEAVG
jgi:hypothetical protein